MGFNGVLSISGDEPLMKALQTAANMEAHKAVVKNYGGKLQKRAKNNAVFTGHYEGKRFKEGRHCQINNQTNSYMMS